MFGHSEDKYNKVYNEEHEGKFSHELIAGAASFAAAKVFEDKQRKEGKSVSHAFAKEMLAGIAGGEVDKLFETKGLDYLDKREAKDRAVQEVQQNYDQHYGGYDQWNPNHPPSVNY
jgi:hypothetical protein